MLSILFRPAAVTLLALNGAHAAVAQTGALAPGDAEGAAASVAAPAPAAAPASSSAVIPSEAPEPRTGSTAEPRVQRSVIEDDNAKIEEVRVRGAVKSITVTSKLAPGLKYEVVPVDAGRNQNAGPSSDRGSTGKSVFRILSF